MYIIVGLNYNYGLFYLKWAFNSDLIRLAITQIPATHVTSPSDAFYIDVYIYVLSIKIMFHGGFLRYE